MRTENFKEPVWEPCAEPKTTLGLTFTTLLGVPKRFQGGVPREYESVVLASNGKIYRIRTDLMTSEVIRWEGFSR